MSKLDSKGENKFKKNIKSFMFVGFGKEGLNVQVSKFGTVLFIVLLALMGFGSYEIILKEISQRNIQIERHRRKILKLEDSVREKVETLDKKEKELKELQEFKDLINAIKNLSYRMMNEDEMKELGLVIYRESKKYRYNWRMIMAVIMTESSFRARLESNDPSYGLMQIKYVTAKEAGKKIGVKLKNKYELYSITKNVSIGGFYLFEQILKFKDTKKAIVAYNLGPTLTSRISRRKGGGSIETAYLIKVLNNYNYLKQNF